jgi:hypothetical protein
MTPEGRIKAGVKKYLDSLGAWYFLPVSNGMGQHGVPDVIACVDGFFLGVECKAPGKRGNTSALQNLQISRIQAVGGAVVVVDDVAQLKAYVEKCRETCWR